MRKLYMLGNWKMHKNLQEVEKFLEQLRIPEGHYIAGIAPQAVHLDFARRTRPQNLWIGAQNCSDKKSGALTGETSPEALKDMQLDFCLIGHSERRILFNEPHDMLNRKVHLALELGLRVVFCVGETLEERERGQTFAVLEEQLELGLGNIPQSKQTNILIAYEPVWAIGTGKTATPDQAEQAHAYIRDLLDKKLAWKAQETSLLYGGSVKPSNVEELCRQPNVDGGLVGGASLQASDFNQLCEVAARLSS